MRHLVRGLLLLVLLLNATAPAWAEFSLTPGITLREEYNDNIDLEAEDEEDDFITTIAPRLSLTWKTDILDLTLNGSFSFKYYLQSGDTETEAGEGSTLSSTFDLYRGVLFLRVLDTYERVTIDENKPGNQDNPLANQTDSNRLVINPYLLFSPKSDLRIRFGYAYENQWYEEEEGDDAESHTFDLGITKSLSPRVSFSLNASHMMYRPKDVMDIYVVGEDEGSYEYDRDSVWLGLGYQAGDRLHLNARFGHTWLDYDVREDTDSEVWGAGVDYEISSSLKAGFDFNFDYAVSVEDGPSERQNYTVYLDYDERIKVRVTAFARSEDYVEINRENDSYGGTLGGSLPLGDLTGLAWGLLYTRYDESGLESEKYDLYGARISVYRAIKHGRLSLGYSFTQNDSNSAEDDYTNNIIYLQASLTF